MHQIPLAAQPGTTGPHVTCRCVEGAAPGAAPADAAQTAEAFDVVLASAPAPKRLADPASPAPGLRLPRASSERVMADPDAPRADGPPTGPPATPGASAISQLPGRPAVHRPRLGEFGPGTMPDIAVLPALAVVPFRDADARVSARPEAVPATLRGTLPPGGRLSEGQATPPESGEQVEPEPARAPHARMPLFPDPLRGAWRTAIAPADFPDGSPDPVRPRFALVTAAAALPHGAEPGLRADLVRLAAPLAGGPRRTEAAPGVIAMPPRARSATIAATPAAPVSDAAPGLVPPPEAAGGPTADRGAYWSDVRSITARTSARHPERADAGPASPAPAGLSADAAGVQAVPTEIGSPAGDRVAVMVALNSARTRDAGRPTPPVPAPALRTNAPAPGGDPAALEADESADQGADPVADPLAGDGGPREAARAEAAPRAVTLHGPASAGHALARQLAAAMPINLGEHTVEIVLDPAELGRVRMTLAAHDGTVTLLIAAERPETLDLMRRHAGLLSGDFDAVAFSDFQRGEGGGEGRGPEQQDRRPGWHAATRTETGTGGAAPRALRLGLPVADRLDLRL